MSNWTLKEMNELHLNVQKMAAVDAEFRREVLANPKEVIEKIIGKGFPDGFDLKVIEQTPSFGTTIVLPEFVGNVLEDSDLVNVAGGQMDYEPPSLRSFDDVDADAFIVLVALAAVLVGNAAIAINAAAVGNVAATVNWVR